MKKTRKIKRTLQEMEENSSAGIIVRVRQASVDFFLILQCRWNGKWGFSKGFKENKESNLSCALRELEEETGVSKDTVLIEDIEPLVVKIKLDSPTKRCPSGIKIVHFYFGFLKVLPNIKLSREHVGYKFVPLSSLKNFLPHQMVLLLESKKTDMERVLFERKMIC
jgi:8-oxo-dGTP pyrophosphatase MutT (NUDIX family)